VVGSLEEGGGLGDGVSKYGDSNSYNGSAMVVVETGVPARCGGV